MFRTSQNWQRRFAVQLHLSVTLLLPILILTAERSLAHKFNDEYLMVCVKLELINYVALSEAYLRLPASEPPPAAMNSLT